MDIIAANTPPEFILQLDVGTCVEAGADPIAWIRANPGRIRSTHLKDWAPGDKANEKGYRVLFRRRGGAMEGDHRRGGVPAGWSSTSSSRRAAGIPNLKPLSDASPPGRNCERATSGSFTIQTGRRSCA